MGLKYRTAPQTTSLWVQLVTIDNVKVLDLDGEQSQVQVPPTTAGQKVPMVIDLHGKNS